MSSKDIARVVLQSWDLFRKERKTYNVSKTVVAADNAPAAAETAFQMKFYSVTPVEPQSEVLESKTSLLGTFRNEALSDTYARTRA